LICLSIVLCWLLSKSFQYVNKNNNDCDYKKKFFLIQWLSEFFQTLYFQSRSILSFLTLRRDIFKRRRNSRVESIAKIILTCRSRYSNLVAWKIYFYEAINKPPTSFTNYPLEVPSRKNVFGVCRSVDHIIHGAWHLYSWRTVDFEIWIWPN